ncbi:molybdopterin-dependent oxidoreductase, partial [Leptolyngbya sp. FACHB-36]|uniref:molybdopterin-dependent oxidoreductase n=1 Tax=Leptolyngbya sp. FACHB-36 TaxID=2692808 RepID=UPI00168124D3
MEPTETDSVSRRSFLKLLGLSGASVVMGTSVLTLAEGATGRLFMPLNDRLDELLLKPQAPVPELPLSAIEPEALLVNSFRATPRLDPATFRLTVDGEVNNPLSLDLAAINTLPLTSMVIRHVCVEGWAAIVQWGGVRLQDIVQLAQPKSGVRYAYFQSA